MVIEVKIGGYWYDLTAWAGQEKEFGQFVWNNEFCEADQDRDTDEAAEHACVMEHVAICTWNDFYVN